MSDCDHCWHKSRIQHAMMNHRCERCCHCGDTRCKTLSPSAPAGHGPYYPSNGPTVIPGGFTEVNADTDSANSITITNNSGDDKPI